MTSGNPGELVGQTLGEYQLEALIGAGGMAEVYRGRDPKLGREVAVKVLPPHFATDAGYVARFRDEARRVAAIDHANIVPVYQFGEERGLLFIVMPLLRESLRERMERDGLPPPTDAMRIAVQVAAALDAAHGQGIIHRDVKPENVLLNQEGRALLTDFGIAREAAALRDPHVAHTLSASGLPVGTPEYMAPEQLRRDNVDQRADIYALGAVLYEMLTGHAPHEASSVYEVAAMALTAPIAPPSSFNSEVWPQLDVAVMTALAKDADKRYPDARTFALALREALNSRNDPRAPKLTVPAYQAMEYENQDSTVLRLMRSGPLEDDERIGAYLGGPTVSASDERGLVPAGYWPMGGDKTDRKATGRRRVALLMAALCVLLLVGVAAGSTLYILTGFGGPTNGGVTLPFGTGAIGGGATATSTIGDTPGATPSATGTTGAGTPTVAAGPTVTPVPGATATATSTPTPTSISQARLVLGTPQKQFTFGKTCYFTQSIYNSNNFAVTWRWSQESPGVSNLSYNVNGSLSGGYTSGQPTGTTPSGASDILNFQVKCPVNSTVTMGDGTYTYTFNVNG